MPVIGYIDAGSPEPATLLVSAFRGGLGETGFVEGRNVAIEFRWAHNVNERLPELAADLVRRRVAVIVAPQSTAAVMEAKAATRTIPIVFGTGSDPVKAGLVTSLNQPGGNITGITFMNVDITAKRLGLLHQLLPNATRFAALINPKNSVIAETMARDAKAAASAMGW
jgi:putative ABC transport system substrate-binding protein